MKWWCYRVAHSAARFIAAEATEKNDAYYAALAEDFDLGRRRGIDATLQKFKLDAIILPTDGTSDYVLASILGSQISSGMASKPAAISGYPIISGVNPHFLDSLFD
jgi:amidase